MDAADTAIEVGALGGLWRAIRAVAKALPDF